MKKFFTWVMLTVVMAVICLTALPMTASAAAPLDQIREYVITVDPQDDGTLFISYYLKWEVLDDKREGPLTYIEVGVPNKDHRINDYSSNVKTATSKTSGGAWVRLDLDRKYAAGEILEVRFSIWQNKLIEREGDDKLMYSFIPGWFDETPVLSETVRWKNSEGILSSTAESKSDGYLIWKSNDLALGGKIVASVTYSAEHFQVGENSFKEESKGLSGGAIALIIIGVIVLIIVIVCIFAYFSDDGYGGGRGYGHTTVIATHHSSCARSSCACAGCACACACAGGGRVGCSRKTTTDFAKPCVVGVDKTTVQKGD
jgi:hypothetical protein